VSTHVHVSGTPLLPTLRKIVVWEMLYAQPFRPFKNIQSALQKPAPSMKDVVATRIYDVINIVREWENIGNRMESSFAYQRPATSHWFS